MVATQVELLERVVASSKGDVDTIAGQGTLVEPVVLACSAGVHHEDDLDPDIDDSITP